MHRGYIKTFRRIQQNPLWEEKPFDRARAWLDLILIANYKEGYLLVRGNKITVKRGQVGWSELALAEKWGWSRGKIRRFLDELQQSKQIVQHKNRVTSLITIVKYELYQDDGTTDSTTDSTTERQQTDTKKKDKKEKKESIKGIGVFENVKLTEDELSKLKIQFGESTKEQIDNLSIYIKSKGDKYKSHYATILSWERKNVKNNQGNVSQSSPQEILPASHVGKSLGLDRYNSL